MSSLRQVRADTKLAIKNFIHDNRMLIAAHIFMHLSCLYQVRRTQTLPLPIIAQIPVPANKKTATTYVMAVLINH